MVLEYRAGWTAVTLTRSEPIRSLTIRFGCPPESESRRAQRACAFGRSAPSSYVGWARVQGHPLPRRTFPYGSITSTESLEIGVCLRRQKAVLRYPVLRGLTGVLDHFFDHLRIEVK